MLAAIINENDNSVTGVFDQDTFPDGLTLIPEGEWLNVPQCGMIWDGGSPATFTAAPVPVPQEVTMRQARLVLLGAGLLDAVDGTLAGIENATESKAAQIEWEYSNTVRRDNRLIAALAASFGLDDAAIDDLFRTAATL